MSDQALVVADQYPGSPEPLPGKCGAKKRQAPGYCIKDPMENGRCEKHGGLTPRGALSPHFKHGLYTTALPSGMLDKFEAAHADPLLLAYRNDLALVQARIDVLLERSGAGESGQAWIHLNRLWREFERHRTAGNVKEMQALLEQIGEPIREGLKDHQAWDEIGAMLDRRARLVELERKRLDQLANMITVEEAMTLFRTVLDVLRRHIDDQGTLDAIGAELSQLVTLESVPGTSRSKRRR